VQARQEAETRDLLIDTVIQAVWSSQNCASGMEAPQDPRNAPDAEQVATSRDNWVMCVDQVWLLI
jgi:hypothetical protein